MPRKKTITAAEVAEFVYCEKAWYLKRSGAIARGAQLARGTAYHRQHAAGVKQAESSRRAGFVFIVAALLLLLGAALLWMSGAPR